MRTDFWKSCHVGVWDFHFCKNSAVDGHGSFVNLIGAVTFVPQVLPCLLRDATRRNTWNWQPPFLFFPLSNLPEWAWTNWISWHAPLFRVPEFCVFKTIQYFLSNKIYPFMSYGPWQKIALLWEDFISKKKFGYARKCDLFLKIVF